MTHPTMPDLPAPALTNLADLDAVLAEGERLIVEIRHLLERGEHWLGGDDD